ncbi:hypothetical protein HDV00_003375 [Rhizophlyctis rosea]|nr:hypothetical protein HDV00_003375 [Rhizophlyctis rosea]
MPVPLPTLKVLVSGGGIAGPAVAFWLNKFLPGTDITIVERSPVPRGGGHAVDLRDAAIPLVRRMGLLEEVKAKHTTEEGTQFVGKDGQIIASNAASGNDEMQSGTSDYEILRGDMAQILLDETKDTPNITYIFDETITSISQTPEGKATVTFANNHLPTTTYDLVVGADGQSSRTRRLVFGDDKPHIRRLGQYLAYFTMPKDPSRDTTFRDWYNAPHGLWLLLRPDPYGARRVHMAVTDSDFTRFDEIEAALRSGDVQRQKRWFEEQYEGSGFQAERVIAGMKTCNDWYMQEIVQVKMERWSEGNVVLLGDAAHCPSPISGMGTSIALIGAYLLAGEISRTPDNISHALSQYETLHRPVVERAQKLFPGAPQIFCPQTEWGLYTMQTLINVLSRVGPLMKGVASLAPAFKRHGFDLPEYGKV